MFALTINAHSSRENVGMIICSLDVCATCTKNLSSAGGDVLQSLLGDILMNTYANGVVVDDDDDIAADC